MADYITLANSNQSLTKRFRAVKMQRSRKKAQDVRKTLSGTVDPSVGSITHTERLTLFVPEVSGDAQYGTRAELETLHALNDPGGTPNAWIRYTNYWGTTYTKCLLSGDLEFEPSGALVGVSGAWYLVTVDVIVL
jgi:hypothetical protein